MKAAARKTASGGGQVRRKAQTRAPASVRSPRMEHKLQEAHRRILEAARTLFLRESGYEKATVRQIAAQADVSVGAVYLHFRSKPEILAELVNEFFADIMGDISRSAQPHGSGREQLTAFLSNLERFVSDSNRILFAQLLARIGMRDMDERVTDTIAGHVKRLIDTLTDIISRGVVDGSFPFASRDPRLTAVVITQCLQGLVSFTFGTRKFRSMTSAGYGATEVFEAAMELMLATMESIDTAGKPSPAAG